MLNDWEKHNEEIARAAASNDREVRSSKTSALACKNVVCDRCSGTGLAERVSMRRDEWAILCENCHGRGFIALAQPKKTVADFGLSRKQESA